MLASLAFAATLTLAASQELAPAQQPYCNDGGQLHCCSATLNGGLPLVKELSNLACYDLTPGTTNCIIADAPGATCTGQYSCCQVNTLVPLLGLFCSPPPGGCVGEEANGECTDLLNNKNGPRFGQCKADDITDIRNGLGAQGQGGLLSALGLKVKRELLDAAKEQQEQQKKA